MYTHTNNSNGGNAVTLTLLGLSVAILAGVAVLYFIGKSVPQPEPYPIRTEEATTTEHATESDPRAGWNAYENAEYEFSCMYPDGWIVATGTMKGVPIISLYDAAQSGVAGTTSVHELPIRVSVYPHGVPVGGEGEVRVRSKTIIPASGASAFDFVLTSGKSWATVVNFDSQPVSWGEGGHVFGRVVIQDEEETYTRGTATITPEMFDPLTGDVRATSGFVDDTQWSVVSEILRSFSFTRAQEQNIDASPLVTVSSPIPNAIITSPLIVKGEAHGSWYFEASFPVRLEDSNGTVLAEVPAQALGDWMVDARVPFEVSLAFSVPSTATSGVLILARDNPSGLPEHDAQFTVPVLFQHE